MRAEISEIESIDVFKNIKKESIEKLVEYGEKIELKKNECLYQDRQILEYVYFIISGKITLCKTNENGESKVIFLLNSGKIINQPLMRKNTSAVECWGFENSVLFRVSFDDFDKIMSEDYTLSRNCMIFMEYRIRSLYRQLKNSVTINIEKKLAAKLYRLGTEYGIKTENDDYTLINIAITNTYLSKMLGCQRETVSRAMKVLTENGIVKNKGRKLYINMKEARKIFKS